MYRPNPGCWVCSPRPPPCCPPPRRSGSLDPAVLSRHEEEAEEEMEEEMEEAGGCAAGYEGVLCQAADARWSASDPGFPSGIPGGSGPARRGPAPSSRQPKPAVLENDRGDASQHFVGGCWCEGPGMEAPGCACGRGQREPEGLGPCWPGSPYIYYGVRRSLVVGVEVVEEVAVEDTVEVITENIRTDDLLSPELLRDDRLSST